MRRPTVRNAVRCNDLQVSGLVNWIRPIRWRLPLTILLIASLTLLSGAGSVAQQSTSLSGALQQILNLRRNSFDAAQAYAQTQGVEIQQAESGERLTVVVESFRNVSTLLQTQRGRLQAKYQNLWQADVPLGSLRSLSSAATVSLVRLPQVAQTAMPQPRSAYRLQNPLKLDRLQNEPIISEGAAVIGALDLHQEGVTGSGVKIGVIDLGFSGLPSVLNRGELPENVTAWNCLGENTSSDDSPRCRSVTPAELGQASGGQAHGTAVAEIVHDVAPDAELHLFLVNTTTELGMAVQRTIDSGIQVVNHSVAWFNDGSFYDGQGQTGSIVRDAYQNGIFWVNAAGNFAQSHYEADFQDQDGDGFHDEVLAFDLTKDTILSTRLTWDAWPRTSEDFDVFLKRGSKVETSSTNTQNGTEPDERLFFTANETDQYRLEIQWAGEGEPPDQRRMEMFIAHSVQPSPTEARSSLPAPSNAEQAFAVGAVNVSTWPEGVPEPFSSHGPTNTGATKPNLVGPDCVQTAISLAAGWKSASVCGSNGQFPGTSAAAPHVAGTAALLLAQGQDLDPGQLSNRLQGRADPVVGVPQNHVGAGKVHVGVRQGPDLAVTNAQPSRSDPFKVGHSVKLTAQVKNQGEEAAGPFWISVWPKGEVFSGRELSNKRVSRGTDPDQTVEVTLPEWTLNEELVDNADEDKLNVVIVADAYDDVAETEEGNNRYEVSLTIDQKQPPQLSVNPQTVEFQGTSAGQLTEPRSLTIKNTGGGSLQWTATTSQEWVQLGSQSGQLDAGQSTTASVRASPTDLESGTHEGHITVAAENDEASGSPIEVAVRFDVAPPPAELRVSPERLEFNAQRGGSNPDGQELTIRNAGGRSLDWRASTDVDWLNLARTEGAVAAHERISLDAKVEISGLPPDSYEGEITVTAEGDISGSPARVPVALTIEARPARLEVTPSHLEFTAQVGKEPPDAKDLTLRNSGGLLLEWEASANAEWLMVDLDKGELAPDESGTLQASVDTTQMSRGTYNATLQFTSPTAENTPLTIDVTLNLAAARAQLDVSPDSLRFSAEEGADNPNPKSVTIRNDGGKILEWQADSSTSWILPGISGGSLKGGGSYELRVFINSQDLATGTHRGTLTVSAAAAAGSPQEVAIVLEIEE